ncbi:MAG: ABC transporter ATP-binding protein [Actinomycetales bacterium]|nr:ABC transporter ATP-binding protein [Actinomycetales bacterium]
MTGVADVGPELAISTRGVRKTYQSVTGRRTVGVEGLDLDVPVGGVHGFLGPNGSGKTTTIRMLLGLVRPDSGTMEIFGERIPEQLPSVVRRVGAIVEQPKFFPTFSGIKNLDLLARAIGAPRELVATVLNDVGLADRGKDAYRTYSLGMKQRLAIAATLLKDPDLLIFDEPTNGLDPAGIREIRDTMRGLADGGKTVLVSSHVLAEVQQVADTVSIIARGRLLASGRVDELASGRAGAKVRVGVREPERAVAILQREGIDASVDHTGTIHAAGVADPAQITWLLGSNGLYVHELLAERVDLESVFLELTQGLGPGTHASGDEGSRRARRRARTGEA